MKCPIYDSFFDWDSKYHSTCLNCNHSFRVEWKMEVEKYEGN